MQKTFEFLMFSAWGPLPLAHGFSERLTVIENTSKSIGKQSQINVSVGAHGYSSLAVRWGRTRESCESQHGTLGNHCKTKGAAFVLAPFLYNREPPAHGFPDGLTVIDKACKNVVKQSKTRISVRAHGYGY